MNKNEFVENLVKEFSVKHPNYSASVKISEARLIMLELLIIVGENLQKEFFHSRMT